MFTQPETNKFRLEDLIFSRTDARGVIQSGNRVLQDVAEYSWHELLGAPHKIVRHPDMPRGLYHMIWEAIKAGRPIGAYMTNLTKSGRAYTVFAILMPQDEGFLAVRLKPTLDILSDVRALYASIRERENAGEMEPQESAQQIEAGIRALGYADYETFMTQSLINELISRCEILKRPVPRRLSMLNTISKRVPKIQADTATVSRIFASTSQIPYNIRLQASRLEGSDGPISVLSSNHQQMAQTLTHSVRSFSEAAIGVAPPVNMACFVLGTTYLLGEVYEQFQNEGTPLEDQRNADLSALEGARAQFEKQIKSALVNVANSANNFSRMCKDMRRMLSGLELTRIMCKIERSKTTGDTEGLDEIVHRLLISERELSKTMTEIENAVKDIVEASDQMLRSERLAA